MPPESNQESFPSTTSSNPQQSIYIIRHGDRWDYLHPEWKKTAERKGDPSLSSLGHEQARQAGKYLDQLFVTEEIDTDQINLLSSPFLRTIQTSNELLSELKQTANDNATTNDNVNDNDNDNGITTAADSIKIQPEHSIFELDLWGQNLHSSLPEMQERQCYFPRIDGEYESMFLPSLPETKEQFFERCDLAMEHISRAFPYDDEKNRVIILVTHAACCIGLVKAGTGETLEQINPAAPCSIYKLTRMTNQNEWDIDHCSKAGGMNGFIGHMKDVGTHTRPWNNFGNRDIDNGYTGPPK